MGNTPGKTPGRVAGLQTPGHSGSDAASTPSQPLIKDEAPAFLASPVRGFTNDAPKSMYMKMDKEALLLVNAESLEVFCTFSYYRILCWGSTDTTFMWKAYRDDTETDLHSYGVLVEATALGVGSGHPVHASAGLVGAPLGPLMEEALMGIIQSLMCDMKNRGIGDEAFAGLINTLNGLAEEGWADHCLTVVKQIMLGRALDARQATQIVQTVGQVSPFDKLEAAVALFGSLMSPQSFLVVLQSFEERGDRDNILHRLSMRIGANGQLEQAPGLKTPVSKTPLREATPRKLGQG